MGSSAAVMAAKAVPNAVAKEEKATATTADIAMPDAVMNLQQAVDKALAHAPTLRAAGQAVQAAKGLQEQAGYRPNPQWDVLLENVAGSGRYQGVEQAEVTYSLQQELETAGKRNHRSRMAEQAMVGSQYARDIARRDLIRDVRVAYYQWVAAYQVHMLAVEQRQLAEAMQRTVGQRVAAAREPDMQLAKAELLIAEAQLAEQTALREVQHARHTLVSLWGGHEEQIIPPQEGFADLRTPPEEEAVERGLMQLPDMQQWQTRQQQQEAWTDLQEAQAVPNPKVMLGVRDLRTTGDQALVAAVTVPIPVFQMNRGNIRAAKAQAQQVSYEAEAAHLQLRNQAFLWLDKQRNSYHQAVTLRDAMLPAAERLFARARRAYAEGRLAFWDVQDARRSLFNLRQNYLQALLAYHLAQAEVERLMPATAQQEPEGDAS